MRMRARVWSISIGALLFVFLTAATAVPAARADSRNDSRHDSRDPRHDPRDSDEGRHKLTKLRQEVDALKVQLAAARASSSAADAALQQQITMLATSLNTLEARLTATSPSGRSSTSVFDGNAKNVGEVIGVDDDNIPWVLTTAHDANAQSYTFALKVFPGQLTGGNILFAGADCTGAAYLEPLAVFRGVYFGPSAISIAGVDYVHGGVVYASAAGAAVTQVDLASRALESGSCFTGPFGLPGSYVVPAAPVTFSTPFTPPYTVR